MALLTNDAREIRQPGNISLDSQETTETRSVAAPVMGLVYSQLSLQRTPSGRRLVAVMKRVRNSGNHFHSNLICSDVNFGHNNGVSAAPKCTVEVY